MDIEKLSKSQIVLLTLLVSFVTSIATGIVTVSLMQQAPPAITQTVNRVVERTVERLVPTGQTASVGVTTEKTVVVKESDLISQAVARISPSIVKLYSSSGDASNKLFLGLGLTLDAQGGIVTDAGVLGDAGDAFVELPDGTGVRAFVVARELSTGIAILQATSTSASSTPKWSPITVADQKLALGQTVIALSGKSIPRIADGLVAALVPIGEDGEGTIVDTNVSADAIMQGSPLINTDGAVVGISTAVSRATSPSGFLSTSVLMKSKKSSSSAP